MINYCMCLKLKIMKIAKRVSFLPWHFHSLRPLHPHQRLQQLFCFMYIKHGGVIHRGWPRLLSLLYQLFPAWVQWCPCSALVCLWRHHNKNKPWNSRLPHMPVGALGCAVGIMEPFDTVKIIKKEGLAWLSVPAEETVSMQLFSQSPHLVEFAAKQEVEVSSAHWYGRNGMARIIVRGLIGDKET